MAPPDLSSMNLTERTWTEASWVSFDTETSGRYPIESEICEIAAVKWQGGREVDSFSSLVKPTRQMSEQVIRIHGITNEMVATAPSLKEVLPKFLEFIRGSVLLAHHSQFDLGFVAAALEDCGLELPEEPTICTSLLAQATVPETVNHKLQTLVPFFNVDPGQAHRALDDARACLNVALRIFERLQNQSATPLTVMDISNRMLRRNTTDQGPMYFSRFSISELRKDPSIEKFIAAIRSGQPVQLTYAGGSRPGQPRQIQPVGLIRQLDGDALVAVEDGDIIAKRYWLKSVQSIV